MARFFTTGASGMESSILLKPFLTRDEGFGNHVLPYGVSGVGMSFKVSLPFPTPGVGYTEKEEMLKKMLKKTQKSPL